MCNGANDCKKGVSEVLGNCACFTARLYLYTSHSGFRKHFNNWAWSILLSAIYILFSTVLDANVLSHVGLSVCLFYMLAKGFQNTRKYFKNYSTNTKCLFFIFLSFASFLFSFLYFLCLFCFLFLFLFCWKGLQEIDNAKFIVICKPRTLNDRRWRLSPIQKMHCFLVAAISFSYQ